MIRERVCLGHGAKCFIAHSPVPWSCPRWLFHLIDSQCMTSLKERNNNNDLHTYWMLRNAGQNNDTSCAWDTFTYWLLSTTAIVGNCAIIDSGIDYTSDSQQIANIQFTIPSLYLFICIIISRIKSFFLPIVACESMTTLL